MRESTTSSFRGKDHCECEREGGWPGEDLQGGDWICSKKYRVLTCSDKNFMVSWPAQTITVWCLDLLRTFKTFHKGRRTACSKCEGTVNAESEVPGISKDLHHRPTIRTQTWQMGTVSCEDGGVRLIGLIFSLKTMNFFQVAPSMYWQLLDGRLEVEVPLKVELRLQGGRGHGPDGQNLQGRDGDEDGAHLW